MGSLKRKPHFLLSGNVSCFFFRGLPVLWGRCSTGNELFLRRSRKAQGARPRTSDYWAPLEAGHPRCLCPCPRSPKPGPCWLSLLSFASSTDGAEWSRQGCDLAPRPMERSPLSQLCYRPGDLGLLPSVVPGKLVLCRMPLGLGCTLARGEGSRVAHPQSCKVTPGQDCGLRDTSQP